MPGYFNEPWAYCDRTGFKTRTRDLVRDVVKGQGGQAWVDKRWADGVHPQFMRPAIGPDWMKVEPTTGNADRDPEIWSVALAALSLPSVSTGNAKSAVRIAIAANTLTASATYLRLSLVASTSLPVAITAGYVGIGDGTSNFTVNPTPLTYGASKQFTIPAASSIYTDRVLLTVPVTSPLLISLDLATDAIPSGPQSSAFTFYQRASRQEAWGLTVTGYSSTASFAAILSDVEVI